jgi:hypothetical protein
MIKTIVLCVVVSAAAASGCAESRQYFRPTEHVYGETMRGEREAIYSLVGPHGPFGEAKVWSKGAFRENGAAVVHATIDIHNTSGAAIVLDPQNVKLEPVRAGAELLHDLVPLERQKLSVAPGAFGSIKLRFMLPEGIHPGQVSSFGLRWEAENGTEKYSQTTPFLETHGRYDQMGPYYGYPPPNYGFAYGYGFGCSWVDPLCRPYGYYGYWGAPGPAIGSPAEPFRGRVEVHRR